MGCSFPVSVHWQTYSSNKESSFRQLNDSGKKLGRLTLPVLLKTIEAGNFKRFQNIMCRTNYNLNYLYRHTFKRKGRLYPKKCIPRALKATLLHFACIYRQDQIIFLLLEKGADPNLKDDLGRTPLQLVIDKWPHFWYLFYERDYHLETPENEEYLEQLYMQSIKCINYLTAFGANTSVMLNRSIGTPADYGETPLHLAVRQNFASSLNKLLKNGADIESYDTLGRTPLMIACLKRNPTMIKHLLDLGANINAISKDGYTSLHLVCRYNSSYNRGVITMLLLHGASVNVPALDGSTPLHYAADYSDSSIVATLMYFGADPDVLNHKLQSPLFILLNEPHSHLQGKLIAFVMLCSESMHLRFVDASGNLPWLLTSQNLSFLKNYFLTSSINPRSLKRFCRIAIRRSIGFSKLWRLKYDEVVKNSEQIFGKYPNILTKYILDWNLDFLCED